MTTSSGYGHTIGKNICYGYLPAGLAEGGGDFEIQSYMETYPARLEPQRALYDPQRKKILAS